MPLCRPPPLYNGKCTTSPSSVAIAELQLWAFQTNLGYFTADAVESKHVTPKHLGKGIGSRRRGSCRPAAGQRAGGPALQHCTASFAGRHRSVLGSTGYPNPAVWIRS